VEAFESFVAVALEREGFVVSGGVKFRVKLPTRKAAYPEEQTHGYEVDLVGARSRRLVLASVKSAFGSRGVVAEHVIGDTRDEGASRRYRLLNDKKVREAVVAAAADRYGYRPNQVQLRLYVGRFSGRKARQHEQQVRAWAAEQHVGCGPIEVFGVHKVVEVVREAASDTQYRDSAVLVTLKALQEAGQLTPAGRTS
jgi:hypothetical protein